MHLLRAVLVLVLLVWGAAHAEDDYWKPPKVGKVEKADLEMTEFPDDPEADAIVLFDVAEMEITGDFEVETRRRFRVKILTESGKEAHSDFRIPVYHEDKFHRFKAATILPSGKKIKFDDDDIHTEEGRSYHYKVFAMPGVTVGAVLDIEYTVNSKILAVLDPWYFQNDVFTRLSQITFIPYRGFKYRADFLNTLGVEPVQGSEMTFDGMRQYYTWTMRDLPPVGSEPYMRTARDYMAAIHFQLIEYRDQYQYVQFINTWPELAERLRESYKDYRKDNGDVARVVAELDVAGLTPAERADALYGHVRDNLETVSGNSMYPERRPQEVLEKAGGSPAEKNLLLVQMARAAGLKADPLLISTRAHGEINTQIPRLTQFNAVLAAIHIGSTPRVYDASDDACPAGLLPERNLVDKGLLIGEAEPRFVDIPHPGSSNLLVCQTTATLSPEGALSATSHFRYDTYRAYAMRRGLRDADDPAAYFRERISERFGEVQIDSLVIVGLDSTDHPLAAMVRFTVPDYARPVSDRLFVELPLINRQESNPFKRRRRTFPVEYTIFRTSQETVRLILPEGYEVEALPETKTERRRKLSYAQTWELTGDTLTVGRRYSRLETVYQPREYEALRSYYDAVAASDKAQFVLRRSTDPVGGEPMGEAE